MGQLFSGSTWISGTRVVRPKTYVKSCGRAFVRFIDITSSETTYLYQECESLGYRLLCSHLHEISVSEVGELEYADDHLGL